MIFLPMIATALLAFGIIPGGQAAAAVPRCVRGEPLGSLGVALSRGAIVLARVAIPPGPRCTRRGNGSLSVALFQDAVGDLDPTASAVKEALRDGGYPWYDADADRVQPVWPARLSWLKWLRNRIREFFDWIGKFLDRLRFGWFSGAPIAGNSIGTFLLLALLAAFFVALAVLWVRLDRGAARDEAGRARLGAAARLGDLPEGIRPADGDPWAEALRRRAAGDLAGAVVCLFAHQLLTLDQLGLIRLAPGRTARQYVQALRDRELVDLLGATLRLFEDVYYGRRLPTVQAFDSVWNRAQVFQERRRMLGAGAWQ